MDAQEMRREFLDFFGIEPPEVESAEQIPAVRAVTPPVEEIIATAVENGQGIAWLKEPENRVIVRCLRDSVRAIREANRPASAPSFRQLHRMLAYEILHDSLAPGEACQRLQVLNALCSSMPDDRLPF